MVSIYQRKIILGNNDPFSIGSSLIEINKCISPNERIIRTQTKNFIDYKNFLNLGYSLESTTDKDFIIKAKKKLNFTFSRG